MTGFMNPIPQAAVPAQHHTGMTMVNKFGNDGEGAQC